MKASLETSAPFLSITIELKNFAVKKVRVLWSQFILLDILKTLKNTCEIVSPSKIIEDYLSRNFPGYPEIFWIIRKICSLSGNVSGYPETFQIIRKISSLSRKYPAYLENIQPIQKISSLSGNFPAYPETFQAIRKLSRLSRNFPDHPENIQPIRKISRQSGKNPDYLEIFQRVRKLLSAILRVTRKNFPDAQKLSGWQCHPATQFFGTLPLTSCDPAGPPLDPLKPCMPTT